jgi:hypothetical protein
MLGHYVSRLGISTADDKVAAVKVMLFPSTLKELEAGVQFFSYYRKFVPYFAAIAEPLHQFKTLYFCHAPKKGKRRQQYAAFTKMLSELHLSKAEEAWEILQRTRTSSLGADVPLWFVVLYHYTVSLPL